MKYIIGSLAIAVLVVLAVIEEKFTHKEVLLFEGKRIGVLEASLSLGELFKKRINSEILIDFDNLPGFIDGKMRARRNMGSCSKRLYWVGKTKVRNGGAHLDLSSRAKFELWTCVDLIFDELKTEILQDTKTLWWHLYLAWKNGPVVVAELC